MTIWKLITHRLKTKSWKTAKVRMQRKESQAEFRKVLLENQENLGNALGGKTGSSGTIYKRFVNYFKIETILFLQILSRSPLPQSTLLLRPVSRFMKSFLAMGGRTGCCPCRPCPSSVHAELSFVLRIEFHSHLCCWIISSTKCESKQRRKERGFSKLAQRDHNSVLQLGWVALGLRVPICEMGQWCLMKSVRIKQGNQFPIRRPGNESVTWTSCEHLDISRDLGNRGRGAGCRDPISPVLLC